MRLTHKPIDVSMVILFPFGFGGESFSQLADVVGVVRTL
jgi:hypothetical protein